MSRSSRRTSRAAIATFAIVAVLAVGCGSSGNTNTTSGTGGNNAPPSGPTALKSLGKGEGALNIIAWAGYAENGSNDPKVNWVGPFEKQTGCKTNVKIGNTSDEMVQLMKTGQYDGVSASGDADLRLIYGGDVAPVNTQPADQLHGRLAVPQDDELQLGQRGSLRHPARLGRQPPHVEPQGGHDRARPRGRSCGTRARRTRAR